MNTIFKNVLTLNGLLERKEIHDKKWLLIDTQTYFYTHDFNKNMFNKFQEFSTKAEAMRWLKEYVSKNDRSKFVIYRLEGKII